MFNIKIPSLKQIGSSSDKVSEELISLPLHMRLTDEDVKYVAEKVIQGYKMYL